MMKVVGTEVVLPDMKILTWEDAQAVVTKASGIVSGLKWKKPLQKVCQQVSDQNIFSVCPVYSEATGEAWLLMLTDYNVIIATSTGFHTFYYEEICKYSKVKGIASNHMVLVNGTHTFNFCWGQKELSKYTHGLLKTKINNIHTINEWGQIVANS